jgi:hypothetical protein
MPLSNTNFDGKLSATINMWLSANYENLFIRNNALFVKLREKGNIKVGGLKMVEPIMFPVSTGPSATGVVSGYNTVNQTAMTGFTGAEFVPAEYIIPISVEEYDLDQQASEAQKVDWAQGVVQNGIERMLVKLEADLWAAEETVGSNGSARDRVGSIRTFFNAGTAATGGPTSEPAELAQQLNNKGVVSTASGTVITSVGGIERAVTGGGYWCTPILNTSQAVGVQAFSNLLSLTAAGGKRADLIITHRDVFDKLMNLATFGSPSGNGGQFLGNSKLGELGFDALRFRSADIITDDRVPTVVYLNGTTTAYGYNAFAINTNYLKLRAKSMKPQLRPVNDPRPLKVWTGRWVGQLTSGHLGRVHARHVNLN